jgi:membrane protease YdiL (CAAX protease family)
MIQTRTLTISTRSAIASLALIIPAPTIGALFSFWIAPGAMGLIVYGLCKTILYLTPALWSRFVDRQPWSVTPPRRGGWLTGIATGIVLGGAVLIAWHLFGDWAIHVEALRRSLEQSGLSNARRFFGAAVWICLVNSLLEEYAFRWFITTRIEVLTTRGAASLCALAFTMHHVIVLLAILPVTTAWIAAAGVFCGGLTWSWLYRRCGSVWPGWLSHVLVDASIMWVGWQALREIFPSPLPK